MNVNVQIDRLVLDGLDVSQDGEDIGAALRTELARLITAASPSPRALNVAHARATPLSFASAVTAQSVGAGIAHSLYGQLNPPSPVGGPERSPANSLGDSPA